jgi:hypothetical protein
VLPLPRYLLGCPASLCCPFLPQRPFCHRLDPTCHESKICVIDGLLCLVVCMSMRMCACMCLCACVRYACVRYACVCLHQTQLDGCRALKCICRVGQNHIYTVHIWYFWQGNHQIYGHIRCIYTVLANPMYVTRMHYCYTL